MSAPIYSLRAVYEGDRTQYGPPDAAGRRKVRLRAKPPMYVSSEEVAVAGEKYWGRLISVGTYVWQGGTWVPVSKVGGRRVKRRLASGTTADK